MENEGEKKLKKKAKKYEKIYFKRLRCSDYIVQRIN